MGIIEQYYTRIFGPILQAYRNCSVYGPIMQADRRTRVLQLCTCTNRLYEDEVLRAVREIGDNIKQWDCRRLLSNPETKRTEGGIIGDPIFEMPGVLNRMIEVVVILVGDLMRSVKAIARAFHAVILMSPPPSSKTRIIIRTPSLVNHIHQPSS